MRTPVWKADLLEHVVVLKPRLWFLCLWALRSPRFAKASLIAGKGRGALHTTRNGSLASLLFVESYCNNLWAVALATRMVAYVGCRKPSVKKVLPM